MSETLESAEALIQLQANITLRFVELYRLLSHRFDSKCLTRMSEVRRYQDTTNFEICLDVDVNRDFAVSFWFEFGCANKQWHVEAQINRITRDGQDTLEEHPISSPTSFEELEEAATQMADWRYGDREIR